MSVRTALFLGSTVLAAAVQVACGTRAPARSANPSLSRLAITIEPGPPPSISWAPDSALGWLHVGRRDKDQVVWRIETQDSTNSMMQSIRYGSVPAGARGRTASVPLEPGVEYTVSVGRFYETGSYGRMRIMLGQLKFTP